MISLASPCRPTDLARAAARSGLACLILALGLLMHPGSVAAQDSADTEGARSFVGDLGDEAIAFLADRSLTQEERAAKFAELFRGKFAVESIARFVAGAAWRTASEAEQAEYIDLFTRYVVNTYAQRLSAYSGEELRVGTARPIDDSIVVSSRIVQPNGPATAVDWRLRDQDSSYQILDVIIEGISMAITQRSEFASVIRAGGGGLDALIAALQRSRFTQ